MVFIRTALALTAFVASPSVCGLRLLTPTGAYPGGVVEESWVSEPSDPATFSLLLSNLNTHDTYALVASVITSAGHVYFTTPDVPSSLDYVLEAVNVTNDNVVYSTTDPFVIS